MTRPAQATAGAGRAQPQAPAESWPERLELGEGARWVDGRLNLVDILSGRLLASRPPAGRLPAGRMLSGRGTGRALETLAEGPVTALLKQGRPAREGRQ
jgi:hypothetical protein